MLKNTTGFNRKLLVTYFFSHFIRRQLYMVFIGFILILSIGLFILGNLNNIGYLLLIELIYLLVVSCVFILLIHVKIKQGLRKGIVRIHYEFLDTEVLVSSVIGGEELKMTFAYPQVKKIVRYRHVVIIYFKYNEALLMDANGFTVGNYEAFRPFILDKLNLTKK